MGSDAGCLKRLRPNQERTLAFVATHPGTRRAAFLGGYAYRFDEPSLRRSFFRTSTLAALISLGMLKISGKGIEKVEISDAGRKYLAHFKVPPWAPTTVTP